MPGWTKYWLDPLYRNSWMLMLNTGVNLFFTYLFWLLASHLVPAVQIGLTTAAISVAAMIVAMSRLGTDYSFTRYFPEAGNPGAFFNALLAIVLLVTVVVMTGFIIMLSYISPALLFLHEWHYLILFIGYVLLTAICDMQGTALVAIRRADLAFLQYSILILRIPLLIALGSMGILGIFLALDITYVIMLVAGIFLLYRKGISRNFHADFGQARKTFRYSLGNYIYTIIATAPIAVVPIMILNVAGASQQAYFYVAYSIATFLFMVPDAIAASMLVEGSHRRPLRATTFKSLVFSFMILVPMVLALTLLEDRVLLLYSPEYSSAAYQLLLLLAISSLFYTVVIIHITVAQVQKNIAMVNLIRMAAVGLTIGLSFVLLHKTGLVGVGYAWLLAHIIISAISGWIMLAKKTWQ